MLIETLNREEGVRGQLEASLPWNVDLPGETKTTAGTGARSNQNSPFPGDHRV